MDLCALVGEHGKFTQVVALLGVELHHEVFLHGCAATMLGALVEREGVEGVHVKGIGWREHEAVIGVLPLEGAFHGRVKAEGVARRLVVHVPVEGERDGRAALHGGIALVPHGAIVHDHGRRVAHALEEEVLIGRRVGADDHLGRLGKVLGRTHLDGIGSRVDILEHIDAVPEGVGHTALHLVAARVEQANGSVVDGHQVVVAIDDEGLRIFLQALDAVVTHVARHDTLPEVVQPIEILVGTKRDVPSLHPAVVEAEQAVGLGDIVVEGALTQVGDGTVATQHTIALSAPLGTERPVTPDLVIVGPHRILAGIQVRLQVGSQHVGIGDLRTTRVATVEYHREVVHRTGARGVAVD